MPGASFGLLRKPSAPPPTPHVDRLMGTVSAWWARAAARLPSTVINRLPQSMQPPKAKASSTLQKAGHPSLVRTRLRLLNLAHI